MKIRDLIEKLNLEIDKDDLEVDLDAEIESLTIHTKADNKGIMAVTIDDVIHINEVTQTKENLDTLGYSFEIGV